MVAARGSQRLKDIAASRRAAQPRGPNFRSSLMSPPAQLDGDPQRHMLPQCRIASLHTTHASKLTLMPSIERPNTPL